MLSDKNPDPVFGQPGWRRRMEDRYGWDKEFLATGIILVLILVSFGLAHADDATGLPQDDPKDVSSQQAEAAPCTTGEFFLPIPSWSRFVKMPPLPEQLTPMGKSPVVAKPAPAAVAETKPDAAPLPKPAAKPKAPASTDDPALIAVSPFLQWVKDHPQEAATQARKQADDDSAGPPIVVNPGVDPYWMPPMIDGTTPAPPVTGSAAIYSTPQR
jgi:hypothetical protein